MSKGTNLEKKVTVCCLIPARNESDQLGVLVESIIHLSEIDEIIIIEGGSTDNTWKVAQSLEDRFSSKLTALKQSGKGKFDAVLTGAARSQSELMIIWDGDGTVSINDNLKVLRYSIENNCAAMGNRLLGRMEKGAMQKANYLGNWFFALLWSPVLRDFPRDMLCGTKVFHREVFHSLPQKQRELDPFGDFALVSHSIKLGHKVKSIKVDYAARKYGSTNIHRWTGGVKLLRLTLHLYRNHFYYNQNQR
jgi:glycosyltransferase involved in cell wall biosynthesis